MSEKWQVFYTPCWPASWKVGRFENDHTATCNYFDDLVEAQREADRRNQVDELIKFHGLQFANCPSPDNTVGDGNELETETRGNEDETTAIRESGNASSVIDHTA